MDFRKMTSLSLRADHKRYFTNAYEHDPNLLASYCTEQWLIEMIESLTNRLTSRQVSKDECEEGGPYTGIGLFFFKFRYFNKNFRWDWICIAESWSKHTGAIKIKC